MLPLRRACTGLARPLAALRATAPARYSSTASQPNAQPNARLDPTSSATSPSAPSSAAAASGLGFLDPALSQNGSATGPQTHFGFRTIGEEAKEKLVGAVFSSVAQSYDVMNDLMSLGIHRLWKDHFVRSLNPGAGSTPGEGWHILDVAGGTGDIAFRMLDHAAAINGDTATRVTVSDINPDMLAEGRKRAIRDHGRHASRLSFVEANAEKLPIPDNSVDLYTVAFGIRNFTHKDVALREAFRVLKPGGVFACLEFAPKLENPLLNALYKQWSFQAIPMIGQVVANDRNSYQYLVESIENFPSQKAWRGMIADAGFLVPPEENGWEDLSFGIAAIHKGVKPV